MVTFVWCCGRAPGMHTKSPNNGIPTFIVRYGIALLTVILASFLTVRLRRWGFEWISSRLLAAVVVNVWHGGFGSALQACVLSALGITYVILNSLNVFALTTANRGHLVLFIFSSLLIFFVDVRRRSAAVRSCSVDHYELIRIVEAVVIKFVDSGKGITPQNLEKLGNPSLRLSRKAKGRAWAWQYVAASSKNTAVQSVSRVRNAVELRFAWCFPPPSI